MRTGGYWLRRNRIAADAFIPSAAAEPETAPATAAAQERGSLDDMTKAELVGLADEWGVDSSGTKSELVDRLDAVKNDAR